MDQSVVAKKVYRNYTIMFHNKVTYLKVSEIDMFDFDAILGLD